MEYLKSLRDLNVRVEKSDGSSSEDMANLLRSIDPKPAGCLILTSSSIDRSYSLLSQDDFAQSHASKSGVFENLRRFVELRELDFMVIFSSVSALFGNAGQTNYCSYVVFLFFAQTSCYYLVQLLLWMELLQAIRIYSALFVLRLLERL